MNCLHFSMCLIIVMMIVIIMISIIIIISSSSSSSSMIHEGNPGSFLNLVLQPYRWGWNPNFHQNKNADCISLPRKNKSEYIIINQNLLPYRWGWNPNFHQNKHADCCSAYPKLEHLALNKCYLRSFV